MTDDEIKDFSIKHAPALAEEITRLCGRVIEKGLVGILREVTAMQLRINELEAAAAQPHTEPAGEAVRLAGFVCGRCGCADVVRETHPPAQPAPVPPMVPPGYVLVPVEPTPNMLAALSGEWHPSRHEKYRAKYRAMIAAAPGAKHG